METAGQWGAWGGALLHSSEEWAQEAGAETLENTSLAEGQTFLKADQAF